MIVINKMFLIKFILNQNTVVYTKSNSFKLLYLSIYIGIKIFLDIILNTFYFFINSQFIQFTHVV